MDQIKNVISSVIEKLASDNLDRNQQLWQAWQDATGKKFLKHATIESYKNGRIVIKVDSPVAMFQLNLKRNHILTVLQKVDKELKSIDLRMGK
ncbi:MAG: DciA family protein, partial [Candidatus Magasanikbacteria bacterium]